MNLQINVIDSILITEERDTNKVLAEWNALDPDITVYSDLQAAQAVKLFLNWSDQNGTIAMQKGDYFTFIVPDIFRQDNITNVTDATIKTSLDEIVATYSIYENNGKKEVKITFTSYVETHKDISGNFWLLLFVGRVDSSEEKNIEFAINGELAASGEVIVNPEPPYNRNPINEKNGYSALGDIYNGYYIFNWTVRLNMKEDAINGFHTLENFSFEDDIPEDSPHVFLTDEIRQELGLLPNQFPLRVGEYTGADSYPPENRYSLFKYQYNSSGTNLWSNFNVYAPLTNGYATVGLNGTEGLNVSNVMITEKSLSADLGTLTRPTTIQYCTMATIKITESALGDSEVAKLFKNMFKISYGEVLISSLNIYRFGSGGTAQGITGDYRFTFTKVDEKNAVLPGALFSLYISEDFEAGADRFVYSGEDGSVTFMNLPEGTYYLRETITPYKYIPNNTIYKVVLSSKGFEIYYGIDYENKLSDYDNKIVNRSESEIQPVSIKLTGTKNFTGQTMSGGMFSFVVKEEDGTTAATGINTVNGDIIFSDINFYSSGAYTFIVEEVAGSYSEIAYDKSKYTITVMVTDDGSGNLKAEIVYPEGGIVFNNSIYTYEPVSITLKGTKNLIGKKLEHDMFHFIVKDSEGTIAATGTNAESGSITFSEIKFNFPGVYIYKVEEVMSGQRGITCDDSIFTVTVMVTDDGNGNLIIDVTYPDDGIVFNNSYAPTVKSCQCYMSSMKCRKSIEGKILWDDNDNAGNARPDYVKITLLRDGKDYKSMDVLSTGDGTFVFCCLPIGKKPGHKYNYQIDEMDVPKGYTKTIEGYNVINSINL